MIRENKFEIFMIVILTMAMLSIFPLAYRYFKKENACTAQGNLFVNSSKGWICVDLKKASEK
jgi:hypothetical protein